MPFIGLVRFLAVLLGIRRFWFRFCSKLVLTLGAGQLDFGRFIDCIDRLADGGIALGAMNFKNGHNKTPGKDRDNR